MDTKVNDKEKGTEEKVSYFRNMITNRYAAHNKDISATGTMGSITMLVGLLIFVILCIFYIINISEAGNIILLIDKAIIIITLGASLLGVRKVSSVIGSKKVDNVNVEEIIEELTEQKDYYKKVLEKKEQEERDKKLESLISIKDSDSENSLNSY